MRGFVDRHKNARRKVHTTAVNVWVGTNFSLIKP